MPIPEWRRALAGVEAVTRGVLVAGAAEIPSRADADLASWRVAIYTSGMGPLLGHWLEAGALTAPDRVAGLLRAHLEQGRRRSARAREVARHALRCLGAAGLRAIAVKGVHTGADYFPEPGARPASDVDLVTGAATFPAAEAALAAAGYEAGNGFAHPPRREWFPPDASRQLRSVLVVHPDDPLPLDLQASLTRVFQGHRRVDVARSGFDTVPWPALHTAADVLRQPQLTAFLAVHASDELHHVQLVRLVELALVIRRDIRSGALTWQALDDFLTGADALRFAHPSLELAERLAPGTLDPDVRRRLGRSASPLTARVMAQLTPATAQGVGHLSLMRRFMWAASPGEFARCAWTMLLPHRTNARPARTVLTERLFRLLRGRLSLGVDPRE